MNRRPKCAKSDKHTSGFNAEIIREVDFTPEPKDSLLAVSENDTSTIMDGQVLADSHYVVSGSIGVSAKVQQPAPILLDCGSTYNVIRRNALPEGWQSFVVNDGPLPVIGDANGRAMSVVGKVSLRVRFGLALYRMEFIVVENLLYPVLLGIAFANKHIEAIWCIKGYV